MAYRFPSAYNPGMRVMREVRFSVGADAGREVTNSYAGWPTAAGVEPWLALRATVAGRSHARTGYLVNIAVIDRLLRERSLPLIRRLCDARDCTGEQVITAVARDLDPHAPPGATWVGWDLKTTPLTTYRIEAGAPDMVTLTQTFEFAAAHRLHCPKMSDAENRDYFGKCNNPNGHGHNYVLEVSIAGVCNDRTPCVLPLWRFEKIVQSCVIERFDHKHLNEDCPEFRDLNPSVEHIARTIWNLLADQFDTARLTRVRVWETAKTYAEYDGTE